MDNGRGRVASLHLFLYALVERTERRRGRVSSAGDGFRPRGTAEACRRATLGRVRFRTLRPDRSPHCSYAWDFEQTNFSPPPTLPNTASQVSRQIVNPFVIPTYTPRPLVRGRTVIFKSSGVRKAAVVRVGHFFHPLWNRFPPVPDSVGTKKKKEEHHSTLIPEGGENKKKTIFKTLVRVCILKNTNRMLFECECISNITQIHFCDCI